MPSQATARKPRAQALPKTIQTQSLAETHSHAHFWAACMLNDDGELQAIERLLANKNYGDVTTRALTTAKVDIRSTRHASARQCQAYGGILYAFHGSKAFAQAAA